LYNFIHIKTQLCETFRDHSTKLGNLFVAIGSSELNDKMASCMTDLNVFVVKTSTARALLVLLLDNSVRSAKRYTYLLGLCTSEYSTFTFLHTFTIHFLLLQAVKQSDTYSLSMSQCEKKNSRRYCSSTAAQEPPEDKKILITRNLLSIVYDAILSFSSALPMATNKFPSSALAAACHVIKALCILDIVRCYCKILSLGKHSISFFR
jgi:hypothetical protein